MATIIDGKLIAEQYQCEVAANISRYISQGKIAPKLVVIIVGDDPASAIYVNRKEIVCEAVGIKSEIYTLPISSSEYDIIHLIRKFNQDENVHGILVQLPLPWHISKQRVFESLDPRKDVDGFHCYNIGRLATRSPSFRPCTPYGIIKLLDHIGEKFKGRHAVVVGASNIVGRPMCLELLLAGATVTVCHRFTEDLSDYTKMGDILIVAAGKPKLIQSHHVKDGATIIDVGIHREDDALVGDVNFDEVKDLVGYITPVPGGVGPMTVAMLMKNTLQAYEELTT